MATSKKDYVAIAAIIKANYHGTPEAYAPEYVVQQIAEQLANYFASQNTKFRIGRFLEACRGC